MTTKPERDAGSSGYTDEVIMYISHNEFSGGPEQAPFLSEAARVPVVTSDCVDMTTLNDLEDAQIDGEPDIIVELIDLYLEDVSGKLAVMREAIVKTDETSLRRAAHSLRGSSANLGARRVAALCGELERAGCADPVRVESLRAGLERECELVRHVFTDERQRRS